MNYTKKDWRVLFSSGTKRALPNGRWGLAIPPYPYSLHYVVAGDNEVNFKNRIPNNASFNITLSVTTSEDWVPGFKDARNNFDGAIAYARAFILRDMDGASKRWWFPTGMPLVNGTHSITASIKPAYWTNVFGKRGDDDRNKAKAFKECWLNPARIGVTFDGQSSYGHGVYAKHGSCSIELVSCIIN